MTRITFKIMLYMDYNLDYIDLQVYKFSILQRDWKSWRIPSRGLYTIDYLPQYKHLSSVHSGSKISDHPAMYRGHKFIWNLSFDPNNHKILRKIFKS